MRVRCIGQIIQIMTLMVMMAPAMAISTAVSPPDGPVLLKISGNIRYTNVNDELWLDRKMLEELPWHETTTHTPWHQQIGRFEGPLLRGILELAGVDSEMVEIHALNHFHAYLPVSDVHNYDVILATKHNGKEMSIREFGPLFVIYPFSEHPELKTEAIHFRSVWQVSMIRVP